MLGSVGLVLLSVANSPITGLLAMIAEAPEVPDLARDLCAELGADISYGIVALRDRAARDGSRDADLLALKCREMEAAARNFVRALLAKRRMSLWTKMPHDD